MEMSFTPGTVIRLVSSPDWGLGRVQSCTGNRLTANFEHEGKVILDTRHATIEIVRSADR